LEVGIILTIFLANGQKGVLTRISAHQRDGRCWTEVDKRGTIEEIRYVVVQ